MKRKKTKSSDGSGQVQMIAITEIEFHPTFVNLLPISEDLLENTAQEMAINGFYPSEPLTLGKWPELEHPVVIDGHMRIRAALLAGITHVPFVLVEFENELEALEHAINLQAKRRSNTDAELYRLCERLDKVMERGGDRRSEASESKVQRCAFDSGQRKSAQRTGSLISCHFRTVEKIRKILKDGTPEIQRAVRTGKMKINRAYNLIREMQKGNENKEGNSSARLVKAAKIVISEENFASLRALDGDLGEHVNRAVEMYIRFVQEKEGA